ncbi:transglutaminase domain-containing protein [Methanoculleus sp. FWC-SCC1]|uniref:Transglutaminase domain-containing protein n=1 Tax=Methanoculleus frigidifontis TaxID=2584085 RepID=A0ABT8MCU8_9EURY|nr:transglutaminase domain-containing protein [Methanoculleus sp. FWC-SCC1]MDN7025773.1 transglutaminase domain-containing protein [Methanoculleus sp. FWC-SCC1]
MRYCTTLILLIGAALLLAASAGCTGTSEVTTGSSAAGEAYSRGLAEYQAANYRTAEASFAEAYALATDTGDADTALLARNAIFRTNRTIMEYPFGRSDAEAAMREAIPGITEEQIRNWLDHRAQTIVSDGETLYFYDVGADYLYAHPEEMQRLGARRIDFDFVSRYALMDGQTDGTGPYVNPVRYTGFETLAIPNEALPATGALRIWYPLPVETDSQRNVTVANLSYPAYIVKGPFTTGPIGYVYYEIPVEKIAGDLNLTAEIGFTSYEQRFAIDPALVGEYDTSDPEYLLYTASERNIEITDAIRDTAHKIVGNETNPHLQAQLIYHHIIRTYPYSHVPHCSLDARVPHVPESTYMFETDHGDCGTQSMLFSAFCRSLGIPARAIGGYQMLLTGAPSSHFWAEYSLPGYGWVPCDPTVADVADWLAVPDEEREAFKEYYAMNLDPARFVIQKNVDAPLDPPVPDDAVVFRLVRQTPAIVSDTADYDIDLACMGCFGANLTAVR